VPKPFAPELMRETCARLLNLGPAPKPRPVSNG
jgi:hypothetical protein